MAARSSNPAVLFCNNVYLRFMKFLNLFVFIFTLTCSSSGVVFSQSAARQINISKDYLSPTFHEGRRQALRNLMPENSVAVIFSYPAAVFSRDVDYVYHPNPDLFYFSGYREPNAMLFIFKEMQGDGDSSYNELFFVQHRDARSEQWTGRRLGVEGVRSQLGFKRVYIGEDFAKNPVDLKKFSILMDELPDTSGSHEPGSLAWLVSNLVRKASIKPVNKNLTHDLNYIYARGNVRNLNRLMVMMKPDLELPEYKNDSLIQELVARPDSVTLMVVKKKYRAIDSRYILYNEATNALRGIKTTEEIDLLKKAVWISSIAHAEAMRAVQPEMSERELEGIMLYVHKKYGAEDEGYPPIVGAGANGCILHYEENELPAVMNQLVLMDVGAQYRGYSADVTRTFPANGKFSDEQKAIYQLVYDAQEEAFKYCHEGITFDSLEAKTTAILAAGLMRLGLIREPKEVKKYYPHGMTHHLGLDVHDKGIYGELKENMVITVEPGIYIPAGSPCDKKWWDIGVRIEDDVLIGKNSYILLSADAPRKWEEVEKTVAEKSIFDNGHWPKLP
jgi:Xaa-Pro aminopeptidase